MIDTDELRRLLLEADGEIQRLRRDNEVLSAKVEMIDLFACVLHTRPAVPTQVETVDVAWRLRTAAADLAQL